MFFGCQQNEIVQTSTDIERAKNWFQQNEANLSKRLSNFSARSTSPISKTPDWSKSKVHTTENGMKSVEVALDYETYLVLSDTEPEAKKPNVINSMLLFETQPGEFEVYLLKIYPDNLDTELSNKDFDRLNYGEVPTSFSGQIMVFDWDERFIGGWKVINGERTKYIARSNRNNNSDGRTLRNSSIICYQVTTNWYQVSCSAYGCSEPVLIDVTITINCEQVIAPPDTNDPGSGGGGGGGEPGCFVEHPFIEGLMVPCEDEEPCDNGFIRDWNNNCYCPPALEIINEQCTFKCPTGYKRNLAGVCVQINDCNTNDPIINALQDEFENIWKASNASHTSIPMTNRLENGGWIVNGANGYSFIPFPDTWIRTPCGIDPPANWLNDLPQGLVAWVHSHPFYVGENVSSVCGNYTNPLYQGNPSRDDSWMLVNLLEKTSQFGMKGYVIDGNGIRIYGLNFSIDGQFETLIRCGY